MRCRAPGASPSRRPRPAASCGEGPCASGPGYGSVPDAASRRPRRSLVAGDGRGRVSVFGLARCVGVVECLYGRQPDVTAGSSADTSPSTTLPRPTRTPCHDRSSWRRHRPAPTADARRDRSSRRRSSGSNCDDAIDVGHARGAGRLRRSGRSAVRAVPRPATTRSTRTTRSARCSSTPAARASAAPICAVSAAQRYDRALLRTLRHRRVGPTRHGRERRRRSTASTTTTAYFTSVDSTPETDEERAGSSSTSPSEFADECVAKNAEILDHIGTNDSARDIDVDPAGARRGHDLVLRVQLRQRARRRLGDDVPRHRAGRRVRRRQPTPNADAHRRRSLQQLSGFEDSLDTFLARLQRRRRLRVPQRRRRRGRVRRADGRARRRPAAEVEADRPPVNRDVADDGGRAGDVLRRVLAGAGAVAGGRPGRRRERAAGAQRQLLPARTGDGTYGNQLEAFQAITCADTAERPTVAEVDARASELHDVAPRLVPESSVGGYTCTFFPPAADPRIADHRRRRRADRGDRHDRRPVDTAGVDTGDGRRARGRPARRRRGQPAHRLRRQPLRDRPGQRLPDRPRGARRRDRVRADAPVDVALSAGDVG